MEMKVIVKQVFDNRGKPTILIENLSENIKLEVGKKYVFIVEEVDNNNLLFLILINKYTRQF